MHYRPSQNLYICKKELRIIQFNNIPAFLDERFTVKVILEYISRQHFSVDQLVYNFVSQEELFEMNVNYLDHTTDTDIISFNYTSGESLRAEFFISLWAVERSAEEEAQTIENECLRVLAHGVLHCMGYNDRNSDEKSEMRKLEDNFIKMFHVKQKTYV
jgi:probable rRNA maturation factor